MNDRGMVWGEVVGWIVGIVLLVLVVSLIVNIYILGKLGIIFGIVEEEIEEGEDEESQGAGERGGTGSQGEVELDCELIGAAWFFSDSGLTTRAANNRDMSLVVTGNNCEGEVVSFEIREIDNDKNFIHRSNDYVEIKPKNVVFDGGIAKGAWTAEWQKDQWKGPEYMFRATIDSGDFVTSGELEVSKK